MIITRQLLYGHLLHKHLLYTECIVQFTNRLVCFVRKPQWNKKGLSHVYITR